MASTQHLSCATSHQEVTRSVLCYNVMLSPFAVSVA